MRPGADSALERLQPARGPLTAVGAEVAGDDLAAPARALLAGDPVEARGAGRVAGCGLGAEIGFVPGREPAHPGVALAEQAEVAPELLRRGQDGLAARRAEEGDHRLDPLSARGREPGVLDGQPGPAEGDVVEGDGHAGALDPGGAETGVGQGLGPVVGHADQRAGAAERRQARVGHRPLGARSGLRRRGGRRGRRRGRGGSRGGGAHRGPRSRPAERPRRRRASRPRERRGLR